jgi:hypothetical protein
MGCEWPAAALTLREVKIGPAAESAAEISKG